MDNPLTINPPVVDRPGWSNAISGLTYVYHRIELRRRCLMAKQPGSKMGKRVLFFGLFFLSTVTPTWAQEYPTKPVNLLVANSAAASVNNTVRLLASNKVEKLLGQPFVIAVNAAGGGTVAWGIVAKQKPDGYHLVASTSTPLVRIPHFRPVSYKFEDFVPILHFGAMQSGLYVRTDSPWKTLREFVEYAKRNPGKVKYALTGIGSPQHLAMEYIAKQEGIQWTAIPVEGDNPVVPLLGGHVSASSAGSAYSIHVRSGALRLLATHGEKRLKSFPDVPTFRECGYDFINESVMMLAAPKGTSIAIVSKLDDAFRKAMDDPEFIRYMQSVDEEITYRNHEDIKKYLTEAYARLGKMIQELKLPVGSEKK